MATAASGSALALCVLAVAAPIAAAQNSADTVDWLDTGYTSEYKAASVVTSLWLAAFAVTSALFGILGAVVALQWPNPKILCYKTSYSDMPSASARSCCSLYSLNLGFSVFWILVFAIMVIARDVVRIVVCLCFCLVHTAVVIVFRMKFKRYGRPERPYPAETVVSSSLDPGGSVIGVQPQAVGIPIYNIPMQTVVVGAPADSTAAATNSGPANGAPNGTNSSYWYDAACIPPQQQGMHGNTQQPAATAAAAVDSEQPYSSPYPAGTFGFPYPPQPISSGPYPYSYSYNGNFYDGYQQQPTGQQPQQPAVVVGAPAQAAAVPASAGAAGGTAAGEAGSVAAAAAAATAAGAAATTAHQRQQQ